MLPISPETAVLHKLTLVDGLGPVLIGRAIHRLGSPQGVLDAPASVLEHISGIGRERAQRIRDGVLTCGDRAQRELELADKLAVQIIGINEQTYPPLLRQISDPPPILYVRGEFQPASLDRYTVAIVGSRSCSHYGTEQAERFAIHLAQSGLTIVSGGARGIDTAAHRAAIRVRGRTLVILGSGLANIYPPENAALFDQIVGADSESNGAVISELPLLTPPAAHNFPARNRIISGLSLGVIVVEAGRRSGALITAKQAAEEHGREVFALPGRIDSPSSEGAHDLLKKGGASLVTHPQDVIDILESAARHHFMGTHDAITTDPSREQPEFDWTKLAPSPTPTSPAPVAPTAADIRVGELSAPQSAILAALAEPRSVDELAGILNAEPGSLRSDLTVLEVRRRIVRQGSKLARRTQ